jgi:hypothetical protein
MSKKNKEMTGEVLINLIEILLNEYGASDDDRLEILEYVTRVLSKQESNAIEP